MAVKEFTTQDLIDFVENIYKGDSFDFMINSGKRSECGCLLFEYSKYLYPQLTYHACGFTAFRDYSLDERETGFVDFIGRFIRLSKIRKVTKDEVLVALKQRKASL